MPPVERLFPVERVLPDGHAVPAGRALVGHPMQSQPDVFTTCEKYMVNWVEGCLRDLGRPQDRPSPIRGFNYLPGIPEILNRELQFGKPPALAADFIFAYGNKIADRIVDNQVAGVMRAKPPKSISFDFWTGKNGSNGSTLGWKMTQEARLCLYIRHTNGHLFRWADIGPYPIQRSTSRSK